MKLNVVVFFAAVLFFLGAFNVFAAPMEEVGTPSSQMDYVQTLAGFIGQDYQIEQAVPMSGPPDLVKQLTIDYYKKMRGPHVVPLGIEDGKQIIALFLSQGSQKVKDSLGVGSEDNGFAILSISNHEEPRVLAYAKSINTSGRLMGQVIARTRPVAELLRDLQ
ncbi:hypothetical protein BCV70DRAFT_197667 [Testicularia cyperi]|uniref:DUF4252 domain-containing protein n=1 Tax=Testicularia cyperi TaxID=1882483 RepID=A0A317XYT9_9BASI|nr:hypothetical protein BCV70DRAFT_197667 [Testicularia cyperi]